MKKFLLSLAVLALGATSYAGEVKDVLTVGLFKTSAGAELKVNTYDVATYTSETTGITYTVQATKTASTIGTGLQFRSKNNNSGLVVTANTKNAVFKNIQFKACEGATTNNTMDVYGNTAAYTNPTELYADATKGTLIGSLKQNDTNTLAATTDYNFFGMRSNNAAIYLEEIIITYDIEGVVGKESANLKFDATSFTATMGKAFTAPTLSKDTDAAIEYTSGNPEVATVDAATGAVTLVAPGTTVITAKAEETEKFYADEASYTLTVLAADVVYYNTCFTDDCGFTSIYADGSFNPWSIDSTYGLKASAFKSNKANASDAIMASPVIDLTNRVNSSVEFDHALNQFKLNGTMLESVDGALAYVSVVAREEGATEWTKLSNPVLPATYSWDYINSGVIDLSAFDGKKMQLGFRYISTEEIAGTWEIKNVQIKDKSVVVVESLVDQNDAPAVYYNLQGVRVANPENGLYIKVQGNKSTKVVIR